MGWGIEYAPRLVAESIIVAPGDMIAIADCGPFIDDDGDGDVHPEALFLTLTGAPMDSGDAPDVTKTLAEDRT